MVSLPFLSRRRLLKAMTLLAALPQLTVPDAVAWTRGSAAPTGRSVLNGFHAPDFPFKNLIKMASIAGGSGLAGFVDANGYPTSNGFGSNIGPTIIFPSLYAGRYKMTWTGTGRFQFLGMCATIYDGGAAVSGLGGANTGSVTNNFTIDGTLSKPVEFDFSAAVASAADNGSGLIRLAITTISNISTSGSCYVTSAGGVTGQFNYTKIDSTHVDLVGSTWTGNTAGGTITLEPGGINCLFLNTGTFSGFTDLILVRSTAPYAGDLAAVQGGVLSQQFNDDFLTVMRALNPLVLRPLDAAGINGSTITRTTYLTPVAGLTYNSPRFPPSTWAGTISGTDAFSCGSYTDMPVSLTDGEVFQGRITNAMTTLAVTGAASNGGKIQLQLADTSSMTTGQRVAVIGYNNQTNGNGNGLWTITVDDATHITLTTGPGGVASVFVNAWSSGGTVSTATLAVGGRAAKIIANPYGEAPSRFNTISAGGVVNCIYDALQDCWLVTGGAGLSLCWPLELRVALCNRLNMHYWHMFPHIYNTGGTDSVTTETNYILANLNSGLRGYFEYSNEVWNSAFFQNQWCLHRGACFAWPSVNNEQNAGYNGLLHRVFMGLVTTAWGGRGGLHRVFGSQAAAAASANTRKYLFEGFDLNGTNYPLYGAAGYSNYDTSPNRPIDYTDDLSYAPYYNGAVLRGDGVSGVLNAGDITGLTGAADNYATGVPANIASAYAWTDNDIRAGTTNGNLGSQTLSFLNTNYYPGFATAATLYSPTKGIVCYESGYQGTWPTTSQCTSLGISTSYGGVGGLIYNLLQGYKKSATFKATVLKQWSDQQASFAATVPAWYTFGQNSGSTPNDQFSMLPTDLYNLPYYTSYDAMVEFNS